MATQRAAITVEAFEQFLRLPENRDRRFELINGEIVEKVVTYPHGIIAVNIASAIKNYLQQNRIGRVAVETRHRPAGDEANDRLPDISFSRDLDKPVPETGAVPYLPDLVVEIKSPDDSYKEMREKARFYLAGGTRMVWLVFPEKKIVEVYTPAEEQILTEGDSVTGGDVLPGLSIPLSAIFEL